MAGRRARALISVLVVGAVSLAGCSSEPASSPPPTGPDPTSYTWRTSLPDGTSMVDGVPERVGGLRRTAEEDGEVVVTDSFEIIRARYEGGGEEARVDMAHLIEPGMAPNLALVNLFFGIGEDDTPQRCLPDSYRGSLSVTEDDEGDYPGFAEDQLPTEGLPWFSCEVAAARPELPSRVVLGWFSGELAWVVTGSTAAVVEDLVDQLAGGEGGHVPFAS